MVQAILGLAFYGIYIVASAPPLRYTINCKDNYVHVSSKDGTKNSFQSFACPTHIQYTLNNTNGD